MTAHRAIFLLAAACASAAAPAAAQVADGIVLNILRECARIDDPTARLACYDNNIRAAGAQARTSVPGRMDVPRGAGGAAVTGPAVTGPAATGPAGTVAGFGSEDVRTPRAPAAGRSAQGDSLTMQVARAVPREPGVYLLTLADGAQWQFAESVDRSYRVPADGDTITIDRAALGSFLMRFDDQIGVRIRRVR